MKIFQKGFNYSQDGDGNRLVYHLQGCNMRCPWCANAEGLRMQGCIISDEEWLLESICPYGAISERKVAWEKCAECVEKDCVTQHDTKGMQFSCKEYHTKEIVEEVIASRLLFYDGGGVTFTGGEATMQFEELYKVLRTLKEQGIHTAIETNGSHKDLDKLFPYIDQLILDCKIMDDTKHKTYTGISNAQIIDNIRKAARIHPRVDIRVPLIGGVNCGWKDIRDFVDFFKEIKGDNVSLEVLTYHEFGKKKWECCGLSYKMTKEAYVPYETRKAFIEEIIAAGCNYKQT